MAWPNINALFSGIKQAAPAADTTKSAAPAAAPAADTTKQPTATKSDSSAPFDKYSKLWDNAVNADGDLNSSVFEKIDPKAFHDAAQKMSFTGVLDADTLQKIAAGGEDATKAFAESMNKVAQAVFAQSTLATTRIVDAAIKENTVRLTKNLPESVRRARADEALTELNPLLANPAVAPVAKAVQAGLAREYPQASAQEIAKMTVDYLQAMGNAVAAPGKSAASNPQTGRTRATNPNDQSWDEWAGVSVGNNPLA